MNIAEAFYQLNLALGPRSDGAARTAIDAIDTIHAAMESIKGANVALEADVVRLKAELDPWRACATDSNVTHVNLLRGTIALTREAALHYAGAQDYDALKAEIEKHEADTKAD